MLYNFTLKNRLNNSYVNFCQLDVCIEYFRYILVFRVVTKFGAVINFNIL